MVELFKRIVLTYFVGTFALAGFCDFTTAQKKTYINIHTIATTYVA